MKSMQIREEFFEFFKQHGHTIVASSSLIPAQDPTLLFANAGMNQFKDVFLGKEKRSYNKAVSIQKCMRAGGKHNDLDNVGFTKRHLTFFEMMGNFSFGGYFKKEAINYAWDFLTKNMKLDPEKLHATVYLEDDESYNIWKDVIKLPESRITKMGEVDNFWQMGDTGPCGPCSEIYYDRGSGFGTAKNPAEDTEGERYLEVWNLVFMQFDKQEDGSLAPLKQKGVDTGMGLERLCVIMQEKDSVFQIDLFMPIIERIEKLLKLNYNKASDIQQAAFHVLADHVRASSMLIADGCAPSNEGRGYVLRKIIRRAALFQQKLTELNIIPDLVDVVIDILGPVYPELVQQKGAIQKVLKAEVEKFSANLTHGKALLEKYIKQHQDEKVISGQQAFVLYDTYGFPLELTVLIAQEHGFSVDTPAFETHMEHQRVQSGKKEKEITITIPENIKSIFTGYEEHTTQSKILGFVVDDEFVKEVKAGTECFVVPDKSPFYVEKGGQVSDEGFIEVNGYKRDIKALKNFNGAIAFTINAPVDLKAGDVITQSVDVQRRLDIMKNHTATHLLQSALIALFGKQIKQSGSLVHPDYLRFDFTYHENLTPEQIKAVEDMVNEKIQENIPVTTVETTYKQAIDKGVIAFFGEKYNPESVRVVEVPSFSAELCGGTHCRATGDIGVFKITEVTALSAGQRRIVAVTGPKAVSLFQSSFESVKQLSQEFKVRQPEVVDAVMKQKEELRHAQHQLKEFKKKTIKRLIPQWIEQLETVGSTPFLFIELDDFGTEYLKDIAHELNTKKPGCYMIVNAADDRSTFYVQCSDESMLDIKKFAQWLNKELGLRGGARPGVIQGGGPKLSKDASKKIKEYIAATQR